MADSLAQIFGTEKDKVNCPFFFKIGACRHGDTCSRIHHRPTVSQTILMPHLYQNPYVGLSPEQTVMLDEKEIQEKYEDFYEDIFEELSNYGGIEELNVCDNLGDHMVGNVYCKFWDEEAAEAAFQAVSGRFFGGRVVVVEYSPVTDFREARCRQYDMSECTRGGFCNFMHLKKISRDLQRQLFRRPSRSGDRRLRSDRDSRDSSRRSHYNDRDRRSFRNDDRDHRSRRQGDFDRSKRGRSRSPGSNSRSPSRKEDRP